MTITTTPCLASELKEGDLFTTSGDMFKKDFEEAKAYQETLLVKTSLPFSVSYGKQTVYRITLQQ